MLYRRTIKIVEQIPLQELSLDVYHAVFGRNSSYRLHGNASLLESSTEKNAFEESHMEECRLEAHGGFTFEEHDR